MPSLLAQLELGNELARRGVDIPPDELERLSRNRNVLAALLEAALAALFLEHGFERIEQPIVEAFASRIDYALTSHVDYKTELQEALARRGQAVNYSVLEVEGPPHDRRFTCAAMIDGEQLGVGSGRVEEGRRTGGCQGNPREARGRSFGRIVAERKLRFRSDLVTALSR